jgi:proteasome lid subunit RPN8/RPN11
MYVCMYSNSGAPGAGERGSQPFIVHVHSLAYLLVDLHAHTTEAEVIGYLGGSWDADLNTLTVRAAYPGKSKIAGATECEMDPISEIEQRAAVEADGLQVVGWYHSHPTFEAIPSMCDVDNQVRTQRKPPTETCYSQSSPQTIWLTTWLSARHSSWVPLTLHCDSEIWIYHSSCAPSILTCSL